MNIHTERHTNPMETLNVTRSQKRMGWVGGILFALFCALSLIFVASPAQAADSQSTIPQRARTELLGPIDEIVSESEWIVAGISVHLTSTTRIDQRVAPAAAGAWVRAEGVGDGVGGLNAARIKILPPHPNVKLEGLLTELTDTTVAVDSISVAVTTTTRIVGNPQPGVDRVEVRANIQTGGGLLAQRVQKEGPVDAPPADPVEDRPEAGDGVQLQGILSSRPNGSDAGLWIVSGVTVSVTAQTALVDRVGPLVEGAWVQVQGNVDGSGQLLARRIRTISQRRYHKVEGILQELTPTSLRVGGINLQRDANTQLEGNPTAGQPVEAEANLLPSGALLAVKIEDNRGEHEDTERHTVEFVGRVETLPAGTLNGDWQVAGRLVHVNSAITVIDEHKGLVDVGALVKVEGTLNQDQSIDALEIAVKRGEEDDNQPGDDHEYARLVGVIEELPANGLLGQWKVDGKIVVVNNRTELEGGVTFAISDTVKVEGYVQGDGSILAREVEKENEGGDDGGNQEVHLIGDITELPNGSLRGMWRVDGKQVMVTPETELKDADYTVGDRVKIEGRQGQNDVIIAEKIEKEDD